MSVHHHISALRCKQDNSIFRRPGVTGDFYYVDSGQDDALSVAPSDATVESSHPGTPCLDIHMIQKNVRRTMHIT